MMPRMSSKSSSARVRAAVTELEQFLGQRLKPRLKNGVDEFGRLLRRDLLSGKGLLKYDADSPLSYVAAMLSNRAVAAVMPSSKYIVNRVLRSLAEVSPRVVVEYGPAEGVMTRRILDLMPKDGRLFCVELNEPFVRALVQKVRDPRLVAVHGDVLQIDRILRAHGIEQADAIVSGIPFSFLSPRERHELAAKTRALLRPGGRFIAYQCTTHLFPVLKTHFRRFETELELRNLPPHFVFTAYR
ncbi:MAG: methyltransferase domain-containing protein [Elusimicrobiota bacterium]